MWVLGTAGLVLGTVHHRRLVPEATRLNYLSGMNLFFVARTGSGDGDLERLGIVG